MEVQQRQQVWHDPERKTECARPDCVYPTRSTSEHKLASLKCGHVFGQTYIQDWIKGSQTCPRCFEPTSTEDVRVIYLDGACASPTSPDHQNEVRDLMARYEAAASELNEKMAMEKELFKLWGDVETTLNGAQSRLTHARRALESAQAVAKDYTTQMERILNEADEAVWDLQRKERAQRLVEVAKRRAKKMELEHKAAELSFNGLCEMTEVHKVNARRAESEVMRVTRQYEELRDEVIKMMMKG